MEPRTEHPSRRFTEPSPLVHRAVARRGYRPATVTITRPVERPAARIAAAPTTTEARAPETRATEARTPEARTPKAPTPEGTHA